MRRVEEVGREERSEEGRRLEMRRGEEKRGREGSEEESPCHYASVYNPWSQVMHT